MSKHDKKCICIIFTVILLTSTCIGLVGCGGQKQFYTLLEAYRQELITFEDLKTIHNGFGQGRKLSEESQASVKAELIEHYDDLRGTLIRFEGDIDASETLWDEREAIKVEYYCGNFSGKEAFYVEFLESQLQWTVTTEIAGLEFNMGINCWIIIWTNPDGLNV